MLVVGDKLEELDVGLEILGDGAITFMKASAALVSFLQVTLASVAY